MEVSGHIEERSKSSYTIVIDLGRDPMTGKRERIYKTVKVNHKKAEKEMRRMMAEIENGTFIKPNDMIMKEFLEKYLETRRNDLAPSTYYSYQKIIEKYLIPNFGKIKVCELQPYTVQEYYNKALETLSPRTVKYHHTILKHAFKFAVRWRVVARNIIEDVDPPKQRKPKTKPITIEDANKILEVALQEEYKLYYPMIYFVLCTGVRKGEMQALTWDCVNFREEYVTINKTLQRLPGKGIFEKEPKSEEGERNIEISDKLIKVLKKVKKLQAEHIMLLGQDYEDNNYVFCKENGQPVDPSQLSHKVKEIITEAGFADVTLHKLRHAHATWFLKMGGDLKDLQNRLGHSTAAFTLDTYVHNMPNKKRKKIVNKIDEAIGN